MRCLRLRYLIMRLWLAGVNNIWEPHGILDEEDGDIVTDYIPVAFVGIELDGKPAHISNRICTPAASKDSRKSNKYRRLSSCVGQNSRRRDICSALVQPESPECTSSTSVDDTLGNSLMIETMYLLPVISEVN